MELEILGFTVIGCILGTITGLVPGLHVNTIALLAINMPKENSLGLMAMIAAMSIVHTFVDFIPSIILGAPSNETFLGVLPGHKLLFQGKGTTAIKLTILGGLFAGIASVLAMPSFILFLEKNKTLLFYMTPWVLITILALMALDEKDKMPTAIAVIILSSIVGILALKSPVQITQPLFCLATGFFGASALIDSLIKKPQIPEQKKTRLSVSKSKTGKNCLMALLGGLIVSLMPSIGASQAAFIIGKMLGKMKPKEYLIMLGGTNTSTMMLSFTALFALGKTRTGSAAAISQLGKFGMHELLIVSSACLLALGFGAIATELISTKALKLIKKIEYKKINTIILTLITAMVFTISGTTGLIFYTLAAAIGIATINTGIKRTNTMAFLMVPTIMHYIPFA